MKPTENHYVFYYPFSYRQFHFKQLVDVLKEHQYTHFQLEQENEQEQLYGPGVQISHALLQQFYYPFIEERLLSTSVSPVHFNRFCKIIAQPGYMQTKFHTIPFTLHSADINLCPFGLGIIALRIQLHDVSELTTALSFAHFFRDVFRIDAQYREIKETLDELYRIQEDRSTDRLNELIFILTVFSMISGIYGMNLVIEKLGEPLQFSVILSYTLFEWIALIITIVGLTISVLLVVNHIRNLLSSLIERKQRARKQ